MNVHTLPFGNSLPQLTGSMSPPWPAVSAANFANSVTYQNVVAIENGQDTRVMVSQDAGKTWAYQAGAPSSVKSLVAGLDGIYAIGELAYPSGNLDTWKTTDGVTWTYSAKAVAGYSLVGAAGNVSPYYGAVGGRSAYIGLSLTASPFTILFSNAGGASGWRQSSPTNSISAVQADSSLGHMPFKDRLALFLYKSATGALQIVTSSDGIAWTSRYTETVATGIVFRQSTDSWTNGAVLGQSVGFGYFTADGGVTWTKRTIPSKAWGPPAFVHNRMFSLEISNTAGSASMLYLDRPGAGFREYTYPTRGVWRGPAICGSVFMFVTADPSNTALPYLIRGVG